jgi:hypothetical protein
MHWILALAMLLPTVSLQAQDLQKRNLEPATANRFTLTDRVWPTAHGDASVCLWDNDALCAISITIDDNPLHERDWWIAMGHKYGFQVTWMLITSFLMDGGHAYFGSWDDWRAANAAGMETQSHTINHYGNGDVRPDSEMHQEYGGSQQQLNDSIPGNRCLVMAAPSGVLNRTIAKQYFIANRGVSGVLAAVNRIDYMNTGVTGLTLKNIQNAINNRSWMTILYHSAALYSLPILERQKVYARIEDLFSFISQNTADIWGIGFARAAQYGQSRDTHILSVNQAGTDLVRFALGDSMNDTLFDQPLTVKVRLDNAWDALVATQGADTLSADIVLHNGNEYALVKAVPDQGEVFLTRIEPTAISAPLIQTATGRFKDTVTVILECITSNVTFHYTTDGSTPDETDAVYVAPFKLTIAGQLKARAFKTGLIPSTVESTAIVIERVAPVVTSVLAIASPTKVYVTFNEPMDTILAINSANYAISNGVTVTAAQLLAGGRTVQLTTDTLIHSVEYVLSVTAVRDQYNNRIADNTTVLFRYLPPPAEAGLTGYWSFDDGDGAPLALDGSGNGQNGVVYNAGFAPGRRNNGIVVKGSDNSYVDLGTSEFGIYNTYQFSLAFWYKINNMRYGTIITRGMVWPYAASLSQSDKKLAIGIRGVSSSFYMPYSYPDSVEYGIWYHVAISHGDSNISYYLNGELVASYDTVQILYKNAPSSTTVGLGVGGMMDELRIYNRGISAAEVAALYADTTVDQPVAIKTPAVSLVNPADLLRIANPLRAGTVINLPVAQGSVFSLHRLDGTLVRAWSGRQAMLEVAEPGVYLMKLEAGGRAYTRSVVILP